MVVYVVVEKAAIPAGSGLRTDHVIFYNYAACMTMERILHAARDWQGGVRDVVVRFGHVKGFDHSKTCSYFSRKARTDQWKRISCGYVTRSAEMPLGRRGAGVSRF
jgi:hypothetical protein